MWFYRPENNRGYVIEELANLQKKIADEPGAINNPKALKKFVDECIALVESWTYSPENLDLVFKSFNVALEAAIKFKNQYSQINIDDIASEYIALLIARDLLKKAKVVVANNEEKIDTYAFNNLDRIARECNAFVSNLSQILELFPSTGMSFYSLVVNCYFAIPENLMLGIDALNLTKSLANFHRFAKSKFVKFIENDKLDSTLSWEDTEELLSLISIYLQVLIKVCNVLERPIALDDIFDLIEVESNNESISYNSIDILVRHFFIIIWFSINSISFARDSGFLVASQISLLQDILTKIDFDDDVWERGNLKKLNIFKLRYLFILYEESLFRKNIDIKKLELIQEIDSATDLHPAERIELLRLLLER